MQKPKIIRMISFILVIMGIMVCLYPLFTSLRSYYEQGRLEKELEQQASPVPAPPVEESGQIENNPTVSEDAGNKSSAGTPVSARPTVQAVQAEAMMRLEIPAINLSTIVVSGTSQEDLNKGPGWYKQSAYPGRGNTAIAGHKNMYGSWFRSVHKLQPGNEIYLTYKGKKYTYIVQRVFPIAINDWSVIARTKEPVLTLTTCYSKTERLACRAVLKK